MGLGVSRRSCCVMPASLVSVETRRQSLTDQENSLMGLGLWKGTRVERGQGQSLTVLCDSHWNAAALGILNSWGGLGAPTGSRWSPALGGWWQEDTLCGEDRQGHSGTEISVPF